MTFISTTGESETEDSLRFIHNPDSTRMWATSGNDPALLLFSWPRTNLDQDTCYVSDGPLRM